MYPRGAGEEEGSVQDDQDLGVCDSLAVGWGHSQEGTAWKGCHWQNNKYHLPLIIWGQVLTSFDLFISEHMYAAQIRKSRVREETNLSEDTEQGAEVVFKFKSVWLQKSFPPTVPC